MKVLILLSILCLNNSSYNIKDFRRNPLGIAHNENIFNVDLGIQDNSRVFTYLDMNNDKKVDVIVGQLINDMEVLQVYVYNYNDGIFNKAATVTIKDQKPKEMIFDVISVDLNNDKIADLVVTTIHEGVYTCYVLYANDTNYSYSIFTTFPITSGIMIADLDGDNTKELIYFDVNAKVRKVMIFNQA